MGIKTKHIIVPKEFDEMLKRQLDVLIADFEVLGIKKRTIPKTKAIRLLTKKILENEEKAKKNFMELL